MHSALVIALAFILFASPTPTVAAGADDLKQECQKIIELDTTTTGTDLNGLSSLVHICREILAKDGADDTEQQLKNAKRGYDFIRFGRSDGGANKKASGSYDYIRFGKRSV
uniref:Uncharacterized protein n=1 Tax=Plectus sambesii TaxID=2011161 RepID=A0A914WBK6_9BILA